MGRVEEGDPLFVTLGVTITSNWRGQRRGGDQDEQGVGELKYIIYTVSYTHLTLPTKRIV
eukprot:795433-Amorphochlora_amoeboformis.AAC.1